MINLYNQDCMPALSKMKDNEFDLAIVDPPYGIKADTNKNGTSRSKLYGKNWDKSAPSKEFFNDLKRVSLNQIIWGANHFLGWCSSGWIVWDKGTGDNSYADCELAYSSFDRPIKKYFKSWVGANAKEKNQWNGRIHPTQKPISLYKWLLKNYAEEGDKILDTHGGSMSIAIACHDLKFDLDLYEIDKDYFEAGVKRFNQHKAQLTIF